MFDLLPYTFLNFSMFILLKHIQTEEHEKCEKQDVAETGKLFK